MSSSLLIGPLTKDLIVEEDTKRFSVGGAVFYQSFIFNSFNQDYTILTTLAEKDIDLLNDFPDSSKIKAIYKNQTLFFKNDYYDNNPNHRKQSSNFSNNPILKKDLDKINLNNFDIFILNPLIKTDIPIKTIKYLKNYKKPIALAIQGFLRENHDGEINLSPNNNLSEILSNIDTVFLDNIEAQIIFKNKLSFKEILYKLSEYGPNEVIITFGDIGSIIYSKKIDEYYRIPSYVPNIIRNPTGAGDTYMASYIIKRFENSNIEECGKFASMTASIKIGNLNHFNKSKKYVESKFL